MQEIQGVRPLSISSYVVTLCKVAVTMTIATCLIFFTTGCRFSTKESIKIGALLPLTGSGALYGKYAKNGIELATGEINQAGGVNGKKLEVVMEDSQSNPASGVSAYHKLLDVDRVPATLVEFSPVVMACASIANTQKSVLLNCGAQTPKIREAGQFVFSAIPDANEEAKQMAEFVYHTLNLRAVATFCINTDTGVATTEVFAQNFTRLGGKILAQERHEQGATDFRLQLARLRSVAPRAVYVVSLVRESSLILKQAAELGMKTQWLSYTSFQGPDIVNVAGPAAEGAIYTYPSFSPDASPQAKAFASAYLQKYSEEPEAYAATFYDGIYALKNALEKGTSGDTMRAGLRASVYQGVAGPIDFRTVNWVVKPLEFRSVRGGRFVRYNESVAK
jgi:branched-chain amino acid transport system substrate-binding protein